MSIDFFGSFNCLFHSIISQEKFQLIISFFCVKIKLNKNNGGTIMNSYQNFHLQLDKLTREYIRSISKEFLEIQNFLHEQKETLELKGECTIMSISKHIMIMLAKGKELMKFHFVLDKYDEISTLIVYQYGEEIYINLDVNTTIGNSTSIDYIDCIHMIIQFYNNTKKKQKLN